MYSHGYIFYEYESGTLGGSAFTGRPVLLLFIRVDNRTFDIYRIMLYTIYDIEDILDDGEMQMLESFIADAEARIEELS